MTQHKPEPTNRVSIDLSPEERGSLAFLARRLGKSEGEALVFCIANMAEFQRYIDRGYKLRAEGRYGHGYSFEWPVKKEVK